MKSRDSAFYLISVLLCASLYYLSKLTSPKRLQLTSFTLPEITSHLEPSFSPSPSLGAKYNFLFHKCKSDSTAQVYDTFVSLSHKVYEVRIPSGSGAYNPTIIPLPPTSHFPFLIVARARGSGYAQTSLICEGNYVDERIVNGYGIEISTRHLGCITTPRELAVPQTPARDCSGVNFMADLPGYHDPRLFWSAELQPLMLLNQQSRYGCFGLWLIDLRSIYPSLRYKVTRGLLNEYPAVTELTKAKGRHVVEKNYQIFYGPDNEPYVQYELGHASRHFAKIIGNGLTTHNLTSPDELSCIVDDATWHQATNPLKVVLCNYGICEPSPENTVYIAFVHKKESTNKFKVQYKRYLAVWKSVPPFSMVAFGAKHIRFDNEDEWEQKFDVEGKFLYTVSIAWEKYTGRYEGYLNERVVISLGVGDHAAAAVSLPVADLLGCMVSCTSAAT
ncbi:hypothetical protein V1512DRAFT_45987 [Lipomyces arxii]|uniref:uncharacterized protein n=1 Tax=Lipomyces arxii TaxID=56418 RepID=UPI0034CE663F